MAVAYTMLLHIKLDSFLEAAKQVKTSVYLRKVVVDAMLKHPSIRQEIGM